MSNVTLVNFSSGALRGIVKDSTREVLASECIKVPRKPPERPLFDRALNADRSRVAELAREYLGWSANLERCTASRQSYEAFARMKGETLPTFDAIDAQVKFWRESLFFAN